MPVKIRLVEKKDIPAILDIYKPYVIDFATSFEAVLPTIQEMEERISNILCMYPFWVMEKNDRVVAYTYASQHRNRQAYDWSCESSVYVHTDFQGQGLGKKGMLHLIESLTTLGYCNLYAGTTLPNETCIRLHQSLGFQWIGTFEKVGWKFGKWHDVGWLQKRLLEKENPEPPTFFEGVLL